MAVVELTEAGAAAIEPGDGGLRVRHPRPGALLEAGMVGAVYRELRFAVPRPKALLGDAAARRLAGAVVDVARAAQPGMRSFRLAAAGSDSAVFRRIADLIAATTSLREDRADGELLIRVRPYSEGGGGGWEVLLRLTPRPLSTRAWRVCNRPGGLNATVAVALNEMLGLDRDGAYLNLMCGSGTLLVERALAAPHGRLVGVDIDRQALECTATNLAAAGVAQAAELVAADIADPALEQRLLAMAGAAGGFTAIAADVPWGDAVGSHDANRGLHLSVSRVAMRLLAPGGRLGVVSHEIRLLKEVFERDGQWRVVSRRQVKHGGHNPVVLVLERV
jgi:23S rRNA G2445 N2-methylase RlmL